MPHYGTPAIWRLDKKIAGSGALGDLGAHIIDLAHYLVGDIAGVSQWQKHLLIKRDGPDGELSRWKWMMLLYPVSNLPMVELALWKLHGLQLAIKTVKY